MSSLVIQQTGLDKAIAKQMNRMEPSAPWHLVMGYVKYKQQLKKIEQNLLVNKALPPLKKLLDKNANTPNTLVLVIGESTNRMQDAAQYDGVVIKPFEKILNDTTKKKFIVIHLLGTYRKYHYRYPDNFNFFISNDLPQWLSTKQAEEYNEYDNAIRYNDHVVSNIIHTFKTSKEHGFLAYFSDHGEEVYDDPKHLFAGRNEGAPTSAMYTIPFIIWRSDSWKKQNKLTNTEEIVHRRYSSSDFIYTWSDLAGMSFEGFDPTRSLVNQDFSKHPIWIGDPNTSEIYKYNHLQMKNRQFILLKA